MDGAMDQNRRQGIVERGTNGAHEGGFAHRELAVMGDGGADSTQQGLFALIVQPKQHVETVIEHRDGVAVFRLIVIGLCPRGQRGATRLKRGFAVLVCFVTVARQDT